MNTQIDHIARLPTTIAQYLEQLRAALAGADPALLQDALYDAEDYLRSELAAQPGSSEAEVVASVAASYGNPVEVAQIYLETEVTVQRALHGASAPSVASAAAMAAAVAAQAGTAAEAARPDSAAPGAVEAAVAAPPAAPKSLLHKVFGVYTDPRTYGALFYLLLSLATGTFYFTWVVTGGSLTAGLLILIIGVPLLVLFLGSVRVLALVEGRLVEALLGVRMPRRPPYVDRGQSWLKRIGAMFTDPRTWATMAYFLLMLPLGVAYFTIALTGLTLSLALLLAPVASLVNDNTVIDLGHGPLVLADMLWAAPLLMLAGALALTLTLHIARGLGRLHGLLAKHLLVRGG